MFLNFFLKLKNSNIPISLNEFLVFLKALKFDLVRFDIKKFYYLTRTCLIKDEKLFDRFDIIFGEYFNSLEAIEINDILSFLNLPKEWLEKLFERNFSRKEINKIKSLGSFEKLIETLRKRLKEQKNVIKEEING